MSMIINSKTFAKHLQSVVSAYGTVRDNLQELFLFAMKQAGNGNYTYINDLMNADLKGTDQRAGQKYIEDHCDVTLGKKDGKFAFTNNKSRGFKYVAPEKKWWEYKPTAQPQVIDPIAAVMATVNKLANAIEGKGTASIAKGKVNEAKKLLAYLRAQPEVRAKIAAKA